MSAFRLATRAFSTSRPRLASTVAEAAAPAVPVKKPVGAFRGGYVTAPPAACTGRIARTTRDSAS